MRKKVRTLLRVSSKQQLHDDDIPVQREQARQYIEKRPDWIFDREYIEKAVSAYRNHAAQREVLQEILADARGRRFDVLLTYMSDRIGRQEEYSFYVAALNRLGVEVWTIRDGQLKTQDHVDKLLNYIRFWQNEGESKKTSMRVRDTQKELVRSGKFVGGRAPYGYELVFSGMVSSHGRLLKKLVVVEEKAGVVRMIYDLATHQGMGYEKIAKELNRQGILAVSANKWSAGTIRSILMNPVYMGYLALNRRVSSTSGGLVSLDRREWIYSREQIPELVIIPQKVWERAQEIREARKARISASKEQRPVPVRTGGRLALTGLAVCGYCGKRLKNAGYYNHWTTKTGEQKSAWIGRYVCPQKCKERACYSQGYLEEIVFEITESLLERLKPVDFAADLEEMTGRERRAAQRKLEEAAKRREALKRDIRTLEEQIPQALRGDGCFSAEKLSGMLGEKQQEEKRLEEKEREIEDLLLREIKEREEAVRCALLTPDWKQEFKTAGADVKKMILSCLIDRIEVRDGEVCLKFRICEEDLFLPETIGFPVPE